MKYGYVRSLQNRLFVPVLLGFPCIKVIGCVKMRNWQDVELLLAASVTGAVLAWLLVNSMVRLHRAMARAESGQVTTCVNCNFSLDLTGESTRCPECGQVYVTRQLPELWRHAINTFWLDDWLKVTGPLRMAMIVVLSMGISFVIIVLIDTLLPWCG